MKRSVVRLNQSQIPVDIFALTGTCQKAQQIRMLGAAMSDDSLQFYFQSPEAKRVVAEFISLNLKSRKTWFERDDSKVSCQGAKLHDAHVFPSKSVSSRTQAIANSINAVMPPGTACSLGQSKERMQGLPRR
jgi:hypothetical protein